MNELARRLEIGFPLIQAGMGGIAGAELAAAVASAGAGGVVALYRMREAPIRAVLRQTRVLTRRPFGVNLIPELMDRSGLSEQVDVVLTVTDPSVFFTFYGIPDETTSKKLLQSGRAFLVMVGSVDDAKLAQDLGASAIILQGTEAGGHLLGVHRLDDLIAGVRDSGCSIPFLGAGGIGSGTDFRRIHEMGAAGCVCGTIFVATGESEAHKLYKQRLVQAIAEDTVVTDVFDIGWQNRRHRVLRNALTSVPGPRLPKTFIAEAMIFDTCHPIPRYSAIVPTLQTRGNIQEMAMYCGQSVNRVQEIVSARVRVESFIAEFNDHISKFQ